MLKKLFKKIGNWRIKHRKKKVTIAQKRRQQRLKAEELRKLKELTTLRTSKEKIKVIKKYLSLGDKSFEEGKLKDAYYNYEAARSIARYYNNELEEACISKIEDVRNSMRQRLTAYLENELENFDTLFQEEHFDKVKMLTQEYGRKLMQNSWARISGVVEDFEDLVLDRWEAVYPRMVELADTYYYRRQYRQAKELFTKCKGIVREFRFGSERTHLIQAFMRFEANCEAQAIMAEMHELVDQAQTLLNSDNYNEALSNLDLACSLEDKIHVQFRDRQRLSVLRFRMNNLREEILDKTKSLEYKLYSSSQI